jgi:hypothetical protein
MPTDDETGEDAYADVDARLAEGRADRDEAQKTVSKIFNANVAARQDEADAANQIKEARKIFKQSNQTKEDKKVPILDKRMADGDVPNTLPSDAGIFHTRVRQKRLFYKKAQNESVINNAGGYVVFGTDRTGTQSEGAGAIGAQKAAAIDICVGRMSGVKKGRGLKDGAMVGASFSGDAARIYISQLVKLDKAFGIADGVSGKKGAIPGLDEGGPGPASGIGIKADDVRIIGRRSIKIVTGRQQGVQGYGTGGEPTALGDWMHQRAPTIELIAGNYTESRVVFGGLKNPVERIKTLQRACLGSNTRDGFKELNAIVGQIWSAVYNLALIQTSWNGVLGVDPFRPWVAAAAPVVGCGNLSKVLASLYRTKINSMFWEVNYCEEYGYKYVCSTNVKIS